MCPGNRPLLRVGPFIIVRRYIYASQHPDGVLAIEKVGAAIGGVLVVMGSAAIVTAAVAALGALAAPTGLLALAGGIVALGKATNSIPPWFIDMAIGAAAGGVAAGVPTAGIGVIPGGAIGAATGLIYHLLTGKTPGPSVSDAPGTTVTPKADWSKVPRTGLYAPKSLVPDPSLEQESTGGGATFQRQSYIPPSSGGKTVRVQTIVYLDKRVLARAISDEMAHSASLPPSGGTMFNPRITPSFPSNAVSL
jgi:hypothetical protein